MTKTAQLLTDSRTAHQQAKAALRSGQRAVAVDFFTVALAKRLEARKSDRKKADPEWLEDARHPPMPGEKQRRYHRVPGLTLDVVAAKFDADLEAYFRTMTGETPQQAMIVENPEIVTPKEWQETKAGLPDLCQRGHVRQLLSFKQRVCQTCGLVETLVETKAVEDTEAFKQMTKEQKARA